MLAYLWWLINVSYNNEYDACQVNVASSSRLFHLIRPLPSLFPRHQSSIGKAVSRAFPIVAITLCQAPQGCPSSLDPLGRGDPNAPDSKPQTVHSCCIDPVSFMLPCSSLGFQGHLCSGSDTEVPSLDGSEDVGWDGLPQTQKRGICFLGNIIRHKGL